MNKLDKDYTDLLKDILTNGNKKEDRTGTGTMSVFGREIRHDMAHGFPLLTTKRMAWKTMVNELLWFLRGDTNIQFLVKNRCYIWNGDVYKNYRKEFEKGNAPGVAVLAKHMDELDTTRQLTMGEFLELIVTDDEFAKKWGELGPIYGSQWRKWLGSIDQLQNLINDLKNNPDSRRLMVTAWNPADLPKQILPPCHYGFQCYTRVLTDGERVNILSKKIGIDPLLPYLKTDLEFHKIPTRALTLKWIQRSCDFPLGVPVNIASYGLLLLILAKFVNMVPEELIGSFGDSHIYLNQIDGAKEQVERVGFKLPTVEISNREVSDLMEYTLADIKLVDYIYHPKIEYPLSN